MALKFNPFTSTFDFVNPSVDTSNFLQISNNLSDLNSVSSARTNLNVDPAGTDNSTNVTLGTNTATALSLSGQQLSLGDVFVQNTGDTMTGALVINNTGSAALTINTDGLIVDGATDRVAIGRALVTGRSLAVGGPTDIYGETNIVVAGDNAGAFKAYLEGEGAARFQFTNKGDIQWGSGSGAGDTTMIRRSSNKLQTYGDLDLGNYSAPTLKLNGVTGYMELKDGITAPSTDSGFAIIYVDTADGSLKVKFGSGTVQTIATDP